FMQRLGIPTARFARVETIDAGLRALDEFSYPVVVKADGLAAGKGVIIAQDRDEAEAAVRSLGPRLVIEEFLRGEEVSFIVLSDAPYGLPVWRRSHGRRVARPRRRHAALETRAVRLRSSGSRGIPWADTYRRSDHGNRQVRHASISCGDEARSQRTRNCGRPC